MCRLTAAKRTGPRYGSPSKETKVLVPSSFRLISTKKQMCIHGYNAECPLCYELRRFSSSCAGFSSPLPTFSSSCTFPSPSSPTFPSSRSTFPSDAGPSDTPSGFDVVCISCATGCEASPGRRDPSLGPSSSSPYMNGPFASFRLPDLQYHTVNQMVRIHMAHVRPTLTPTFSANVNPGFFCSSRAAIENIVGGGMPGLWWLWSRLGQVSCCRCDERVIADEAVQTGRRYRCPTVQCRRTGFDSSECHGERHERVVAG